MTYYNNHVHCADIPYTYASLYLKFYKELQVICHYYLLKGHINQANTCPKFIKIVV